MEYCNTLTRKERCNLDRREEVPSRTRKIRMQDAIAMVVFTSVFAVTAITASAKDRNEDFEIVTEIKDNGDVNVRVLKNGQDSNIFLAVGDKITIMGGPIGPQTQFASQVAELTYEYVHHENHGPWWWRQRRRVVTQHARTIERKVFFDSIREEFKLVFQLEQFREERNLKVSRVDQMLQVFDQGPLSVSGPSPVNVPKWNPTPQDLIQGGAAPGFENFKVKITEVLYPGGRTKIGDKTYSVPMFEHTLKARVIRQ